MRRRLIASLCTLLIVGWGCDAGRENAADDVVDDRGRAITLDRPAQRVVSLIPATTELLFAIGAGDRLVGRTRWGDFPPEAREVPSIGDGLDPNVEVLAARRPDLVVVYASHANAAMLDRLDGLGIPTVSLSVDAIESVSAAARTLGRLTGVAPRADSMAAAFDARLDSLRSAVEHAEPRPRVLILSWDNPPIVIGTGSFLSQLVELAGARNAFDDIAQPSAQVTMESIVEHRPDIVLVVGQETSTHFSERREWQAVEAVRQGRLVRVEGSEFSWPSFRAVDAVGRLKRALAASPR